MNLKVGDTIPLKFQLEDMATDKFPVAVIRDAEDVEIAGSPFTLSHVANGLYTSGDAVMPNTKNLSIQFLVYADEDHEELISGTNYGAACIEVALQYDKAAVELKAFVKTESKITAIVCDCE